MKKFFLPLIAFLLFFYVISTNNRVWAQDAMMDSVATPPAAVEYNLAYPGLLPDNPLHFLKAIRDKIVSILINDPEKRAEFNLLTSDKRINAAEFLSEKGEDALSVSTLSKSNNYLSDSINAVIEAKKMNKNADTVLHNQDLAILKHLEVLAVIRKDVDKKYDQEVSIEEKRLKNMQKTVKKLEPK
ncbi:MAG TPA: DUF5667 domain-containing protein [Patescibacteria group bacterium]|nr:DUF5667 domain-containing protein [Patescibacteria group bacterium]